MRDDEHLITFDCREALTKLGEAASRHTAGSQGRARRRLWHRHDLTKRAIERISELCRKVQRILGSEMVAVTVDNQPVPNRRAPHGIAER
jgi:hypothetical protein